MLALFLLAQVAAATPASTPAAALGSAPAAASVSAKPKTLADLARERKLGQKGVSGGSLSVSGAEGDPAAPAAGVGPSASGASSGKKARVKSAEADVQAARRAVDDAAVKKGMTSEDTAAARKKLDDAKRELSQAREAATRPDP
ncbi:MAG: hypothetical protein ABI768_07615 [Acidobacteriota bacterium]